MNPERCWKMKEGLSLTVSDYCPFCLRCHLALNEKALEYKTEVVDLTKKASFPEKLSPYGRVPVLQHGDSRIYESSIIVEYLEDVFPGKPLLPEAPVLRAEARYWIDFSNTRFMPAYFNLLKSPAGPDRDRLRNELIETLYSMDTHLGRDKPGGTPWFQASFGLADISIYPFFDRFSVVEEFRGVHIPESLSALRRWLSAMRERPCIRKFTRSLDADIAYFRPFYED